MIKSLTGNLLEAKADAFVNTVNCVGVMGKGIALQFKQAFPDNYREYEKACKKGQVRIGRMYVYEQNDMFYPKYIINFPTKRHWKTKSRLEDIELGLRDLIEKVKKLDIKSIAVPPLGSGLGGLNWKDVKRLIVKAFDNMTEIEVLLFEPRGAPKADEIPISTSKPNMTRGRALLIKLLELYQSHGYRHSLLEIQKLMYFMQNAGENLRLKFKRDRYGPYAENLHHVLQRIDGHFIRGYGDRSGRSEIYLLKGASEEARSSLEKDEEANKRLESVKNLIKGFETPYGMELLATVHWIASAFPETATDPETTIKKVQEWSTRKKFKMRPHHIRKAWQRLKTEHWIVAD